MALFSNPNVRISVSKPTAILAGALALSVLFFFLSGTAQAQIAFGGGPIDVRAERAQFLDREGKAIYSGSVVAKQGLSELRADTLTIEFQRTAPAGTGGIGSGIGDPDKIVAAGNVLYLTPAERARSNRAVYDYKTDTITMTGDVVVTRGEDVLTGETLIIEVATGKSTMQGGRVRTVINPRSGSAPAPQR